jgi:hypothetical protein
MFYNEMLVDFLVWEGHTNEHTQYIAKEVWHELSKEIKFLWIIWVSFNTIEPIGIIEYINTG